MAKKARGQQNRKAWFKALRSLTKGRYKEPRFIFLGEKFQNGSIIISNHEGTDAPLSLELYREEPIRMWGAHEMNSGVVSMYKYQSQVYFHERKHWNIHAARAFCLIASPLTNLFYKGINLISTYRDGRFTRTLRESIAALKNGENIVVFPEHAEKGYLAELEGFFLGFVFLAELCYKKGMDVPIVVTYFKKDKLQYIFDNPILYSELIKDGSTRRQIADRLLSRCNELGKMEFDDLPPEKEQKSKDTAPEKELETV